ncbi:MAG: transcriptional regulator [Oceanospirillaceae bacterium]|jgi:TrpR family trp operon transcriptional repressor|nr:transcriptional regulator [Oceanospirillaceae bacterium]MBT4441939.1 transcriptional regulator [Oceanospirillaceae bacterium]MBT6076464.1 transcriptional regulator [Oceanospirillaceae bacterium]MBT7330977.1 transcriptional regulator [Oceanospirillaceae bacterium]
MPYNKAIAPVSDYLLLQTDAQSMTAALEGLLTPNEQQELINRLQIFELLSQGLSQRQVAQQLGVGIATVTRGSRALQAGKFARHSSPTPLETTSS